MLTAETKNSKTEMSNLVIAVTARYEGENLIKIKPLLIRIKLCLAFSDRNNFNTIKFSLFCKLHHSTSVGRGFFLSLPGALNNAVIDDA